MIVNPFVIWYVNNTTRLLRGDILLNLKELSNLFSE
jgi:hypothetical protein